MQIISYHPKKTLELAEVEERKEIEEPKGFGYKKLIFILILLGLFLYTLPRWTSFSSTQITSWIRFGAVLLCLGALLLHTVFNIVYLKADTSEQKLTITTQSLLNIEKKRIFHFHNIQQFTFAVPLDSEEKDEAESESKDEAESDSSALHKISNQIHVEFSYKPEKDSNKSKTFSSSFNLKQVDTKEEVLDIGIRLASIIGMKSAEITNNDHNELRLGFYAENRRDLKYPIELDKEPEQRGYGSAQTTKLEQLYKDDQVERDGRLNEILTENWNPDTHSFEGRILENQAGHTLSYKHSGGVLPSILFLIIISVAGWVFT